MGKEPHRPDFELFKKECKWWLDLLGIKDFNVVYEYGVVNETGYAQCQRDVENLSCVMRLVEQDTLGPVNLRHQDIEKDAFHEALHLLFAHLMYVAECRFCSPEELYHEEERVVRILSNSLYPVIKKALKGG